MKWVCTDNPPALQTQTLQIHVLSHNPLYQEVCTDKVMEYVPLEELSVHSFLRLSG